MTVETDRASTEPAAANGTSRTWGFEFRVNSKADARLVLLDDLDNETVIDPDDWDIAGLGEESGAITYPRVPAAKLQLGDGRIRIDRVPPFKQQFDLIGQGRYSAAEVERMVDTVVWMVQALEEEKNRLKTRILNVIAAVAELGDLDLGALGDLQALVTQALDAATSATASEAAALASEEAASTVADGIAEDVQSVQDNAVLVDQMVQGLPGTEYAPGKESALAILTRMEALLALAPVTQVVTIGDHAGESTAAQVFPAQLKWKGAVVLVNRAAASTCTLKFTAGTHLKAPDAGYDGSVAIIRVINNCGAGGTVVLEGPANPAGSGDIVTKPSQIFQKTQVLNDNTDLNSARTVNVTGTIPAGTNRRVAIYCFAIFHATPSGSPTMTCAQFTNITVRDTDGIGLYSGSDPILGRVWTAEISGSAEVAMTAAFALAANLASAVMRVVVYKDASAVESYDVFCRTAAGTSETYIVTPTVAGAAIDMIAAHQGADALTGMTVGAGEDLLVGKTPAVRNLKDMAYATNVDLDVPASAQTKTGASAKTAPGAIAGMVFLPVTVTGGGGGDDQMYAPAAMSKTLARYEQADVLLYSSGTIAFMTRDT
jgi:hypothetical protein